MLWRCGCSLVADTRQGLAGELRWAEVQVGSLIQGTVVGLSPNGLACQPLAERHGVYHLGPGVHGAGAGWVVPRATRGEVAAWPASRSSIHRRKVKCW